MGGKARMVGLWCAAIASGLILATQSAKPTWLAGFFVALCVAVAVWATVMYEVTRRRKKRWDAGDYDAE